MFLNSVKRSEIRDKGTGVGEGDVVGRKGGEGVVGMADIEGERLERNIVEGGVGTDAEM